MSNCWRVSSAQHPQLGASERVERRAAARSQRLSQHPARRLFSASAGHSARIRLSSSPLSGTSTVPYPSCTALRVSPARSGAPRALHPDSALRQGLSPTSRARRPGTARAAVSMRPAETAGAVAAAQHVTQQELAQDAIVWATQHGLVRPCRIQGLGRMALLLPSSTEGGAPPTHASRHGNPRDKPRLGQSSGILAPQCLARA